MNYPMTDLAVRCQVAADRLEEEGLPYAHAVREARFDFVLDVLIEHFGEASDDDDVVTISDERTPKTTEHWRRLATDLCLSEDDIQRERHHEIALKLSFPWRKKDWGWASKGWARQLVQSLPSEPSAADVLMALRMEWRGIGDVRRRVILLSIADRMPMYCMWEPLDFLALTRG